MSKIIGEKGNWYCRTAVRITASLVICLGLLVVARGVLADLGGVIVQLIGIPGTKYDMTPTHAIVIGTFRCTNGVIDTTITAKQDTWYMCPNHALVQNFSKIEGFIGDDKTYGSGRSVDVLSGYNVLFTNVSNKIFCSGAVIPGSTSTFPENCSPSPVAGTCRGEADWTTYPTTGCIAGL